MRGSVLAKLKLSSNRDPTVGKGGKVLRVLDLSLDVLRAVVELDHEGRGFRSRY